MFVLICICVCCAYCECVNLNEVWNLSKMKQFNFTIRSRMIDVLYVFSHLVIHNYLYVNRGAASIVGS